MSQDQQCKCRCLVVSVPKITKSDSGEDLTMCALRRSSKLGVLEESTVAGSSEMTVWSLQRGGSQPHDKL